MKNDKPHFLPSQSPTVDGLGVERWEFAINNDLNAMLFRRPAQYADNLPWLLRITRRGSERHIDSMCFKHIREVERAINNFDASTRQTRHDGN